jgi:hypothetical protein
METDSLVLVVVVFLVVDLDRVVGKRVVVGHEDDDDEAWRDLRELRPTTGKWENAVVEGQQRPAATTVETTIAARLVGIVLSDLRQLLQQLTD